MDSPLLMLPSKLRSVNDATFSTSQPETAYYFDLLYLRTVLGVSEAKACFAAGLLIFVAMY